MCGLIDPRLREFCTDRQWELLEAVDETGSYRKAAAKLGVNERTLTRSVAAVKKRAAAHGLAPGHFNEGVAPGYRMGKVTVHRVNGETVQTWERQLPEQDQEALQAAIEAVTADLPRLKPIEAPAHTLDQLCNLYTITDFHMGMLAWHKEGGADWDVKIAERTLIGCFEQMVMSSPKARVAIVNQLGDFLHSDGLLPLTPTSHHVLDQDGRFSKIVEATIKLLRRVVDIALMRHEQVIVIMAEGNHDMASSVWLRQLFRAIYENEPRVTVNTSELPYYVHQHGEVMLAFHHGHLKKNDQLPLLFAAQFPTIWGATTKRFAHTGHRHHVEEREHSGMTVIQHPTLAARDAYAARGGWIADRQASAITYHAKFGQVSRVTVSPEMLEAA